MEVSPFLQAIQKLAGSTAGEKMKSLNNIAAKIIATTTLTEDPGESFEIPSSTELPVVFIPYVKVEIARMLKHPDPIFDALKSDDTFVFERALKAKWFFDGSNENFTNVEYFNTHIFTHLSVKHRIKLIKVLAKNLGFKNTSLAEDYYLSLSQLYEESQVMPLLLHCSDTFIWEIIKTRRIKLSPRYIKLLYEKYPNIVLNYLKLSKANNDRYMRNMHNISLGKYGKFLPQLLKKHTKEFVELIEMYQMNYGIKLNSRQTLIFLRNALDALLRNPVLFAPMLSLKIITSKLDKEQFKNVCFQLLPETLENFYFKYYFNYMEYYEGEKMPFFLSIFEERYHKSFCDCYDLIVPEALLLLSQEDRVRVVRKKMATDVNWNKTHVIEHLWRCYLPVEESIPAIKNLISKTTEVEERALLLKQLIYTCRVNDDNDALLEVFKYITTRHKNEQGWALLDVWERFLNDYKMKLLSLEHWNVLKNSLKILHVKDEFKSRPHVVRELIIQEIYLNWLNNLPVYEEIVMLVDIIGASWDRSWNVMKHQPKFERMCLDEMIKIIPMRFPEGCKIRKDSWLEIIETVMRAIYNFNENNSRSKEKLEMMSVKNYAWLVEDIKKYLNTEHSRYWVDGIKSSLKKNEPELYKVWYLKYDEGIYDVLSLEALILLKKNHQKIIQHWEKYYDKCKTHISSKCVHRFIRSCRWYEDLGIKFVEKALDDLEKTHEFIILALLLERSAFERIIIPFTPKSTSIDFNNENNVKNYSIVEGILRSFSVVNTAVSLEPIADYFGGDYTSLVLGYTNKFSHKFPADKILSFAEKLLDRPITIRKQAIRLYCLAANNDQCKDMLLKLWRTEKHRSIRSLLYDKMRIIYMRRPDYSDLWTMICKCIDELTEDDTDILKKLIDFKMIPNECVVEYVRQLFATYERLYKIADITLSNDGASYVSRIISTSQDEVAFLFPEDYHEEILQTYFANLSLPTGILEAAREYLVHGYIESAGEKLVSRLNFYSNMLVDILKNNWNVPHPRDRAHYPANYLINSATNFILRAYMEGRNSEKLQLIDATLKAFNSVRKPHDAPLFYLNFTFASLFNSESTHKDIASKVMTILPTLIDIFSIEFIDIITTALSSSLKNFYFNIKLNIMLLDLVEEFIESKNDLAMKLTATFLANGSLDGIYKSHPQRYQSIIEALLKSKDQSVLSKTYMHINTRELEWNMN